MGTMMKNALRERARRKELYIVAGVALLVLLLFGSDASTITISGEPVSGFSQMFRVQHVVANGAGCLLALLLSMQTIPQEYQEKRSHLVWVRGISQRRYHTALAGANFISAVMATGMLYVALAVYAAGKGMWACLPRMVPGFLVLCINIGIVSLLASALSIVCAKPIVGFVGGICVIGGIAHELLDLYRNVIGGASAGFVKGLLWLVPDLHSIQAQAVGFILRDPLEVYPLAKGLLTLYVLSLGLWVLRKKEA